MDYSVQATLGKRMIIVCSLFACHYSKWLVTTNNVTLISLFASDGCFGFNGAWWYLAVAVVKYAAKSNPCARNMAGRSAMHLRSSETLRKFVPCPRSRRRMEGVDGNSGHPMTPRNYPKLVFDHGVWLEELACMYNVFVYIIYIYIFIYLIIWLCWSYIKDHVRFKWMVCLSSFLKFVPQQVHSILRPQGRGHENLWFGSWVPVTSHAWQWEGERVVLMSWG